jgi:two-component system sensor histidine kinase KdpD
MSSARQQPAGVDGMHAALDVSAPPLSQPPQPEPVVGAVETSRADAPLLVAFGHGPGAADLVRYAHGLVRRSGGRWFAVYRPLGREARGSDTLLEAVRLAERLGAETAAMHGQGPDLADEIVEFAARRGVGRIVVGRPPRGLAARVARRSLAADLAQRCEGVDLHVAPAEASSSFGFLPRRPTGGRPWFHEYIGGAAAVFVAAGVAQLLSAVTGARELAVVMLVAVLYAATAYRLAAALSAALLAAVVYNFFLSDPALRLDISVPADLVPICIFVAVAVVVNNLAGRLRNLAEESRRRERHTNALFQLGRDVAAAADTESVLRAITAQARETMGAGAVILLPDDERQLSVAHPLDAAMGEADWRAAGEAMRHGDRAGRGSGVAGEAHRLYQLLRTSRARVGVLGLEHEDRQAFADPEFLRLARAFADLAAIGLERIRLSEEIAAARLTAESEILRSALLSSISHDFRTPLASIMGSASSLIHYGSQFSEEAKNDLLETISEEAERLNRFIGNILDMTRLESGALAPKRQWIDVEDLVSTTIDNMRRRLARHEIRLEIEPMLPLLHVDIVLLEQVLNNLLDNAIKYSRLGDPIVIRALRNREAVLIEVADQGVGIAPPDLKRIFDKFVRARARDRRTAGTGLGLAICKGIVEAHGGWIEADSGGEGRGSAFRINLPIEASQSKVGGELG